MTPVGYMAMPANFKYSDVLKKGKPQHEKTDLFRVRHPEMKASKRAKLFAPFDALRGFRDLISSENSLE